MPNRPLIDRGTAKTTRMRKLACLECGYTVRCSRAMMLRGLPGCPCGSRLIPDTLEDAHVCHAAGVLTDTELAEHPEQIAMNRELSSILHGQAAHAHRGRSLADPAELAFSRVTAERRARADAARLQALADHSPFIDHAAAAAAAEMPF